MSDVDINILEMLLAASQHDIPKLRQLIQSSKNSENPVNAKDPETGYTPLHAAIAACEPVIEESSNLATSHENGAQSENVLEAGRDTVKFLLQEGAIWNDLDQNDETPGCLAKRLGLIELYELMVDAGVRAELLFSYLEGYKRLADDDSEDDYNEIETQAFPGSQSLTQSAEPTGDESGKEVAEQAVTSSRYLQSNLTFQNDRLLDEDQNGIMMAWESHIMLKTAKKLLPTNGLRVLNIGHGMGIVDGLFQEQSPGVHHIVEAHPEVVAEMRRNGWHEKPGVYIHEGRWQDVLPKLVEQNCSFDAIYYDTFAESYSDFREFLSEQVVSLLDPKGKWGFFNGMGADRQISYDVYQKVVEMDLSESGFDIEWGDIRVPKFEGEWAGIRRRYWVVENYRLPICTFNDIM